MPCGGDECPPGLAKVIQCVLYEMHHFTSFNEERAQKKKFPSANPILGILKGKEE